jgi:serine/threonine-protein kinase
MGEVYEASHARLAGRYAVKVLQRSLSDHGEALERFRREAEITSSLRHPNIVHVMDFNRLPDGSPYLVMEYLEGVDPRRKATPRAPTQPGERLDRARADRVGAGGRPQPRIVHRDLKPQNIFIVPLPGRRWGIAKGGRLGIRRSGRSPLT